ncbi:DNA repair protein RadA [Thermoanaerobacter kivui]|uniref:DNA repair protein RadA n=1 Tax=Thermoanaerobacter kivui TaxID=2325 RepID=A0A097ATT0_THEKI|nr:DNA repair protein RadA [Thermoanaerobacter kivui]AIS53221.1 DNA repair protein RadA [Thermoanaerobacter kivui]
MAKPTTKFVCRECGFESSKWLGRCPNCDTWNSFEEEKVVEVLKTSVKEKKKSEVFLLKDVIIQEDKRVKTGIEEFDRVLGGGIIRGSLVLIGGDPGIGKSTLLLQVAGNISKSMKVLYVSGEESLQQIKLRADRILKEKQEIYLLCETNIEEIERKIENVMPGFVIIDSIQTMYTEESPTIPGSISQVRQVTQRLMEIAKQKGISIFIIGHVTKEGAIAGPKVLEHMVDTVLYFEGDRTQSFRILRAVKNRFGSTNEIGVFDMEENGLREIRNPSEFILSNRPKNVPGTTVVCSIQGTRPILMEVQSLLCRTNFGVPRRMATGFDYNRSVLLLAVIEKRLGINLSQFDAYINVAGGMKIQEPAADLGVIASSLSGYFNIPIPHDVCFIGEVGLTGEVRGVSNIDKRIGEAQKMGFSQVFIPDMKTKEIKKFENIKVIKVKDIKEILDFLKQLQRQERASL